mmetsp:Transcript_18393/g.29153  ORF Transcript_18393/g.29153 Transcript_18393/m.29153 type:complete len:956 (+) Transcript_18393:1172-4039(+)
MTDRAVPAKPAQNAKQKAAERKHRREKATQELVDTETTYNTLLGLLITHYVQPLADYKLISNEQHMTMFPQLQIIKGLSDKFLEDLKTRREHWDPDKSRLSDLFETFTPYFRMYQGYVNNHEKSVSLMRRLNEKEKWQEYCASVRPLTQRADLSSLLILPIQRLPRYKLLLSEILKNTADGHPDGADLAASLEKVQDISLQINAGMKEFERREIVRTIERKFDGTVRILEPHRQFIREGKLWKVCRNKDRLYHFFLFNDLFIYASSYGAKYKFHNSLPLNAAFSVSRLDAEAASNYGAEKSGRLFSIVSEKKSFVVYADTESDAHAWLDEIQACLDELVQKTHFKTDSHSAGIWVPDSHQKTCSRCSQKFGMINRRHHCRRCGALVCGKCSKHKLPNSESVMQRACKQCYFQVQIAGGGGADDSASEQKSKPTVAAAADDEDDDEDDFENENAALHAIAYYVDITDESLKIDDIFNKFGHGVGSYVLVPADMDRTKSEYYTVTLVVYTQSGFESFRVSLFEKKGAMMFRLDKKLKSKDFNDMASLLAYLEKKEKLILSYAIPRSEVENTLNRATKALNANLRSAKRTTNTTSTSTSATSAPHGLQHCARARALFDFEAMVHGDLTVRAGDLIYILEREESNGWWTGCIVAGGGGSGGNGGRRQGLFPSTYVEVFDEGSNHGYQAQPHQAQAQAQAHLASNEPQDGDILVARYDYNEGGAEELAFVVGDEIELQAKDDSGWWLGKLLKNGVVGWFAPDLVECAGNHTKNAASPDTSNGNESNTELNKNQKKIKKNDTKSPTTTTTNKTSKKASPPKTKTSKAKAPPTPKKKPTVPATGSGSSSKKKNGGAAAAAANDSKRKHKASNAKPPPPSSSKKKHKKDEELTLPADMGNEPKVCISLAKLKQKQVGADVDKTKLERYLSNAEFFSVFKMSRAEFASKPGWKQKTLKKEVGLF